MFFLENYGYLIVFIFVVFALGGALILLPLFFNSGPKDSKMVLPYECGFDAIGNTEIQFDVRFYLVGIIFIVFDVEIILTIVWSLIINSKMMLAFLIMMFFFMLMFLGLFYEYKNHVLEWD